MSLLSCKCVGDEKCEEEGVVKCLVELGFALWADGGEKRENGAFIEKTRRAV